MPSETKNGVFKQSVNFQTGVISPSATHHERFNSGNLNAYNNIIASNIVLGEHGHPEALKENEKIYQILKNNNIDITKKQIEYKKRSNNIPDETGLVFHTEAKHGFNGEYNKYEDVDGETKITRPSIAENINQRASQIRESSRGS
jgi:hypothetical protein